MAVGLYDIALRNKIAKWVLDPNMTILDPDETDRLFKYRADISNDRPLQLPLIAISRDRDIELVLNNKRPMSYMGKTFNSNGLTSDHLNAIPINIGYQIDIYTRFKHEADEYVRNFVFNIINHPKLEIHIPYNESNLDYVSFMSLISPISDNSDIPERLIPGQFTRMTLRLRLNDAYLFSYNYQDVPKITSIEIQPSINTDVDVEINASDVISIDLKNNKGDCKCLKY